VPRRINPELQRHEARVAGHAGLIAARHLSSLGFDVERGTLHFENFFSIFFQDFTFEEKPRKKLPKAISGTRQCKFKR